MSMTALFRGKWGQKSQENPEKQLAAVVQPSHDEDDDDDDPKVGFSREPIRRNSRFYRSMRKKRLVSSEQSGNSTRPSLDQSPSGTAGISFSSAPLPHKSPLLSGAKHPQLSPQLHHSRTVLPSNGETSSRHALYNSDAADRTREVGGGRSVDISAASISQHRDFTADMIPYRTHSIHTGDIKMLSEQTAAVCTVQEVSGKTMSSLQPCSGGEDQDNINLRLLSKENSSKTISHSLNIIKNIAFLYQEYRDTSKLQEIELRRQRETLSPVVTGTVLSGTSVMSPPVLQLQLRNSARSLSLWQNLEAVQSSGLLTQLPQKEIIMQEAMFELVTSEASYYKSLEILETHFLRNPVLINTLSQSDMHFLFSNIEEVMKASERFLMDLEHRIEKSILISDVCDIVHYHAVEHFNVFIKYVINQVYQEKNYRRILEGNPAFREAMAVLENHPRVRGLSFTSFLILPFQRITRLKLLVQNILKKAEENSEREANAIKAHQQLEQVSISWVLYTGWVKRGSKAVEGWYQNDDETLICNISNGIPVDRSDKLRWMCALTPNRRTRFMSTSAHQPDSPQVQCIQSYSSQEPDELSIEMADVLNLLERTDDGWMMGERLHDGERGWFPSRVVEDIQSKEVRVQNLREAFRIQQTQEGGGGQLTGARVGLRVGRRTPKFSNFSSHWIDQMGESSAVKQ
ncbi:ephexin-1 [Sparus aurata]|uniref:ephexin-1 n=1 Tax=Sparus aurata TaxID=8175 RepID=UPI0011C14EAD|nr:ephexin-1-like [Sparus aurata]